MLTFTTFARFRFSKLRLLLFFCLGFRIAFSQSTARLDRTLDSLAESKAFQGFGLAYVNQDGILYEKGFGFSDGKAQKKYTVHTIQNIASVSKVLVGLAICKAVDQGKIDLDEAVAKYLPFKVENPRFPEHSITFRHLATHTSSIQDNEYYYLKNYYVNPGQNLSGMPLVFDSLQVLNAAEDKFPLAAYLEKVLAGEWREGSFTEQPPGRIYTYSNVGTALAAFALEKAVGQPFDAYTRQFILEPLGMKSSGWSMDQVPVERHTKMYESPERELPTYSLITYPDGGFITSAHDLALLLTDLVRGLDGKGILLSKAGYREFFKPQLAAENFLERNTNNPYNESYNVGIFIGFGFTGLIGHTGGDPGVTSCMFIDPHQKTGRLLMLNTNIVDQAGVNLFYQLLDALKKGS